MRAIFAGSSDTTCPANRVVGNTTATAHKAAVTNVRKPGFLFIQSPLRFERGTFTSPASCSFPRPSFLLFRRKNKLLLIVFQEFLDERLGGSFHFPHGAVEKNLTMVQEENMIGESFRSLAQIR